MKHILTLFFLLTIISPLFGEGFSAGTTVATTSGYTKIEDLKIHDSVITYNFEKSTFSENKVTAIEQESVNKIIRFSRENKILDVATDQFFYIPLTQVGVTAQQIKDITELKSAFISFKFFDNVEEIKTASIVYKITIEHDHNFYVSENHFLVHNYPVYEIFQTLPTALEIIKVVATSIVAGGVFYWLFEKIGNFFAQDNQRNKLHNHSVQQQSSQPNKDPKKRKDNELSLQERRIIAKETAKKLGYKRTKNYKFNSHGEHVYEKGNKQITLDRDCHSGGFWKVYQRGHYERLGTYNLDLTIMIGT